MPSPRTRTVAAAAAILVAGGAWAAAEAARPAGPGDGRPMLRFRAGGFVYRFDPVFRTEALFDAEDRLERRDLAAERPDALVRLRGRLLAREGVASLEAIPDRDAAFREELMRNGYLPGGGR